MKARLSRTIRVGSVLLALVGGAAWLVAHFARHTTAFEEAEQAASRRDFKRARELLNLHLKGDPDDADALLLAARTARRDGDPAAAKQFLLRLQRRGARSREAGLESDLLLLSEGNSILRTTLLARCRAAPGHEDAGVILEALVEAQLNALVHPHAPHDPVRRSGRLEDARAALALWFERDLNTTERLQGHIWNARARALHGEHAGALDELKRALEIDPEHAYAGYLLAMLIREEDPAESCRRLEALHARHPEEFPIAMLLALQYRDAGRSADAIRILDRLEGLQPDFPRSAFLRGIIALDQGRAADAEPLLRRVLERDTNDPDFHAGYSRCMRQLGRAEDAARHHDEAEKLDRQRRSPKP